MKHKQTTHTPPTAEDPAKPGKIFGINRHVYQGIVPQQADNRHFFASRKDERTLTVGVKPHRYADTVAAYRLAGYSVTERD